MKRQEFFNQVRHVNNAVQANSVNDETRVKMESNNRKAHENQKLAYEACKMGYVTQSIRDIDDQKDKETAYKHNFDKFRTFIKSHKYSKKIMIKEAEKLFITEDDFNKALEEIDNHSCREAEEFAENYMRKHFNQVVTIEEILEEAGIEGYYNADYLKKIEKTFKHCVEYANHSIQLPSYPEMDFSGDSSSISENV